MSDMTCLTRTPLPYVCFCIVLILLISCTKAKIQNKMSTLNTHLLQHVVSRVMNEPQYLFTIVQAASGHRSNDQELSGISVY